MAHVSIRQASTAESRLLAAIQEEASVVGVAHIFPPDRYPFPTEAIRERWRTFEGRLGLPLGFHVVGDG